MNINVDLPIVNKMSDAEIIQIVLNQETNEKGDNVTLISIALWKLK